MILRAAWVVPVAADPIEDGAVVVEGDRIVAVGPARELVDAREADDVVDLGRAALLPGFVNVHSHLEITTLRGRLDGLGFVEWWRELVRLKRDTMTEDDLAVAARLGAAEMLRAGTTFVGDCGEAAAPALVESGLRGVVFEEVFAPDPSWVDGALDGLRRRLDASRRAAEPAGARVRIGASPHSSYMACDDLLDAVARLADELGLPLSIHVAESDAEGEFVRQGKGPIARHFESRGWPVAATGESPLGRLARCGWLDLPGPLQLVHGARLDARDLDRLESTGPAGRLGLAACPRSNAALGNGAPAVTEWTRRGLRWGLGTDGAPAVGACDAFSEMRQALFGERARTGRADTPRCAEVLARATNEAARSLGLEAEIGALEAGRLADLCAVSLEGAHHDPGADPVQSVVLSARPSDVRLTMVSGRVLWDGRHVATLDEAALLARAAESASRLR